MSRLQEEIFGLIQDSIYDSRRLGKTIEVASEVATQKVIGHIAGELSSNPKYAEEFRAAWLKADAEGQKGSRVDAGLAAVAEMLGTR